MPGFEGSSCEKIKAPSSIAECASQCLDGCMKKCDEQQIMCYTRCSSSCNKEYFIQIIFSCLENNSIKKLFQKK